MLAMRRWLAAGVDSSMQHCRVHYTSQKLPSGNFVATVTLGRCISGSGESECRTGGEANTIRGAEQLAAVLAVAYLEQLPSDDQMTELGRGTLSRRKAVLHYRTALYVLIYNPQSVEQCVKSVKYLDCFRFYQVQ